MSFAENEKIKMSKLQAMELFVIAVREGSFSAAGRRNGLSPASVSRRIGELEARLGVQLFNRTTRHLALTEAGKAYLQRVEPALHSIEDAEAAALALQSTPRGTLRVHSRMLFGMTIVMPLMPQFQKMYPELKVELSLSERRIQLREEDFDIDLRIAAPKDESLMQRRLLAAERILVAAPDYIARTPAVREPDDLVKHNCLTYWMGANDVVWRFMRKGKLKEMTVPSSFSANNGYVLHQLAVMGHGIALLDDYTVSSEIERGQLRRLLPGYRVTNSTFDEGIYATFLQTDYLPGKIRAFVDFLAAQRARPGQERRIDADAVAGGQARQSAVNVRAGSPRTPSPSMAEQPAGVGFGGRQIGALRNRRHVEDVEIGPAKGYAGRMLDRQFHGAIEAAVGGKPCQPPGTAQAPTRDSPRHRRLRHPALN